MAIKDVLAQLRCERGLTQDELAEKVFVTRQALSRWETGETEPSIDTIKLLADALDVPAASLLGTLKRPTNPYEDEAREKYGDEAVNASNARLDSYSSDEWSALNLLEESIKVQLRLAMATGDVESEEAAELAHMHQRWICAHWGNSYSTEAHLGLAQGYLADERFTNYYDNACGTGATEFLVKTLQAHLR